MKSSNIGTLLFESCRRNRYNHFQVHDKKKNSSPSAFIVLLEVDKNDLYFENENKTGSSTSSAMRKVTISYDTAYRIGKEFYEKWWKRKLSLSSFHDSSGNTTRYITIAFLCENSPDMWMHLTCCWHLQQNYHNISIVMLNVRWTPIEMARTLCSHPKVSSNVHFWIAHDEIHKEAAQSCFHHLLHPSTNHSNSTFKIISLPTLLQDESFLYNLQHDDKRENVEHDISFMKAHDSRFDATVTPEEESDDAIILFTSGTSSVTNNVAHKGVRLSHLSLQSQAMAKLQQNNMFNSKSSMLASSTPWFHIGGLSSALAIFLTGGTMVFAPHRTNIVSTLPHVNTLVVVPAMLHNIFQSIQQQQKEQHTKEIKKYYLNIRAILVGGQSLSQTQQLQCFATFPNAYIVQTYACTEAGSSMTFLELSPKQQQKHQSQDDSLGIPVGKAPPHVELKIVSTLNNNSDKEERKYDNSNEEKITMKNMGVIATRGCHLMNGYWNNSKSQPFCNIVGDNGGRWYLTNDLGYMSKDGMLFYVGRADDVIRTGSESVIATQVEQTLMKNPHPLIAKRHNNVSNGLVISVIPLSHDKYGQMVCAVIEDTTIIKRITSNTFDNRTSIKITEIPPRIVNHWKQLCSPHLAGYKFPKRIFLLAELPRNTSGKILKRRLIQIIQKYTTNEQKLHHSIRTKLSIESDVLLSKL